MSKISFMTFASSDWTKSPIRYRECEKQIKEQYNFFNNFFIWNENNLCEEYQKRFSEYYKDHGFAYFSWKPYSIRQALMNIEDGEYLLYLDSGCVLPMDNIENFLKDIANAVEVLERGNSCFGLTRYIDSNPNVRIPNACIVRRQILEKFNLVDNRKFLFEYPHYQAGLVLIKNTRENIDFLSRWYDFFNQNYEGCIRSGYNERNGQWEHFLHNGSDQAVLQCLLFTENKKPLIMDFFYRYNVIRHQLG